MILLTRLRDTSPAVGSEVSTFPAKHAELDVLPYRSCESSCRIANCIPHSPDVVESNVTPHFTLR